MASSTATPSMMNWMSLLADATRARLLWLLEQQELTVAELCSVVQLPQSTVSRHLKLLTESDWVAVRREGTRRLYRMQGEAIDEPGRRLWALVREQTAEMDSAAVDADRLASVLERRRTRSRAFFSSEAGQWDRLREELFGSRFDLIALAALLDPQWTVGDLGCGTAQLSAVLAPYVRKVVAVDESQEMLRHARARLKGVGEVDCRRGDLTELPIESDELDAAIVSMVLHHLPQPTAVLAEAARVLRPGGRLLVIDLVRHDRIEYRQQFGHVWPGFEPGQMKAWFEAAGFEFIRTQTLPVDPEARGPGLFTTVGSRAG